MGKTADEVWAALPLRSRLPEYVALFASGAAGAVVAGAVVALAFGLAAAPTVGYSFFVLGLCCLLGGGASGGGYKTLGFGQGAARRNFGRDENPDVLEDLRGALRPGRNPAAFFMVVAGFLYLSIALGVLGMS